MEEAHINGEAQMTLLQPLRLAALGLATLAAALVSGFFYAYFCSVMVGFATAPPEVAIAAMQAINATVRNAPFAFSFSARLALVCWPACCR